MSVAIIDYGSGNLHSAAKAFERASRTMLYFSPWPEHVHWPRAKSVHTIACSYDSIMRQ